MEKPFNAGDTIVLKEGYLKISAGERVHVISCNKSPGANFYILTFSHPNERKSIKTAATEKFRRLTPAEIIRDRLDAQRGFIVD